MTQTLHQNSKQIWDNFKRRTGKTNLIFEKLYYKRPLVQFQLKEQKNGDTNQYQNLGNLNFPHFFCLLLISQKVREITI